MLCLRASMARPRRSGIATDYDGSIERCYKSSALSNLTAGKTGLISFWVRFDGDDTKAMYIYADNTTLLSSRFVFGKTNANKLYCALRGLVATNLYGQFYSVAAYTASATWHHVIASWSLATGVIQMYVDGASDISISTNVDGTIGYATTGLCTIGALDSGGGELNGALSELWFNDEYLDLSVAANREKFRSSTGHPVDLGVDGSTPTGNVPVLYMPTGSVPNKGSGGAFTSQVGALELIDGPT